MLNSKAISSRTFRAQKIFKKFSLKKSLIFSQEKDFLVFQEMDENKEK